MINRQDVRVTAAFYRHSLTTWDDSWRRPCGGPASPRALRPIRAQSISIELRVEHFLLEIRRLMVGNHEVRSVLSITVLVMPAGAEAAVAHQSRSSIMLQECCAHNRKTCCILDDTGYLRKF